MKISTKYILASALSGILIFGSSCSDSWLQNRPIRLRMKLFSVRQKMPKKQSMAYVN